MTARFLKLVARWRDRRSANRYDRALRAPMSPATAAELRRLESGDFPRRKVRIRRDDVRLESGTPRVPLQGPGYTPFELLGGYVYDDDDDC